ncbi:phosphotransferase family protein [Streptomyces sp. NPDC049040]|uniref:phosphotransferase family protein n=1 Tax=Streptomyces sp. NPDC049040 TaxID=3365593 RepID=UPI00371BDE2B
MDGDEGEPGWVEGLVGRVRPGVRVLGVVRRTRGPVSNVYAVRCGGPDAGLIVKVYAAQWRWKQQKEVHVYRMLARHGVGLIPEVLLQDGDGGPLGGGFTVMTLLEGRPLSEVEGGLGDTDVARIYRQIGGWLAGTHRIGQDAYGYVTTGIIDPLPDNTAYMERQFATKLDDFGRLGGDPALLAAMRAHVAERSGLFAHCTGPVLCHNDIHEGNVLVGRAADGGWDVTGFIDVENALAADPLMDLAKADYYAIRGSGGKRAAFFEGYGTLPAGLEERLALYRLFHALELWDFYAATGRPDPLPGIAEDIGRLTG